MKYVVAGGRDFSNEGTMLGVLAHMLVPGDLVISGTAKGADVLGEKCADYLQIPIKRMPADWETHGKAAGHIRNLQMAQEADGLIAFWDGKSKGTKNMIENAHKARLETHVYYY